MTVVRIFGYKERRRQIRQSRTNNRQWLWLVQRRFRGGQYCEHLPTSARTGQNNGMDFVLRNLRHLTHVPERGLKVLGSDSVQGGRGSLRRSQSQGLPV
jgi:hypothetical protein